MFLYVQRKSHLSLQSGFYDMMTCIEPVFSDRCMIEIQFFLEYKRYNLVFTECASFLPLPGRKVDYT